MFTFLLSNTCFETTISSVRTIIVWIELKHWPCGHKNTRITLSRVKMMGRWNATLDWRRWLHGGSDV